jgi:hypothetical protein
MGRIYPDWDDLNGLRTPLTNGERALAQFLDEQLPQQWRIYVQPYVNDMRPDIVVMNPWVGMVVFEVKDWDISRYSFQSNRLVANTTTQQWIEEDPAYKADWYANSLYEQFLVSDEAVVPLGTEPNNRMLSRAAVYFHCATTDAVKRLYGGRAAHVIKAGHDLLSPAGLRELVRYYWMPRSKFIRDSQVEALERFHTWLVPPNHAIAQVRPTRLAPGQAEYAKPASGFRRIRGVAGAGKTIVLSHRAARANAEGRRIAVFCFNITMSHILRDLINQAPFQVDWTRLTWSHFHAFAKKQGVEAGLIVSQPHHQDEQYFFDVDSTSLDDPAVLLNQVLASAECADSYRAPKFGGIYIDEGQDFQPEWLDALAGFLEPEGELVLFADHRQNIYGKDGGRDNNQVMKRCRFRGPWAQLPRKSHRLPWRIAYFLNEYAHKVGLGDQEDLPIEDYTERMEQRKLALDVMAWANIDSVEDGLDHLGAALILLGNPNPSDVVVLLPDHKSGLASVQRLSSRFHQIVHVFGEGGADSAESRRRKMAFWMGRGGLKMSTIHSFKGWEIDNVILLWPPDSSLGYLSEQQKAALFYTGVSRGMRNLVVLNANREYDRFNSDWDNFSLE